MFSGKGFPPNSARVNALVKFRKFRFFNRFCKKHCYYPRKRSDWNNYKQSIRKLYIEIAEMQNAVNNKLSNCRNYFADCINTPPEPAEYKYKSKARAALDHKCPNA